MTVLNLSKELPATITLPLAFLTPDTLVIMANDLSNEIHELTKLEVGPGEGVEKLRRAYNELQAYRSLYVAIRDHVLKIHGQPYISEILSPEWTPPEEEHQL